MQTARKSGRARRVCAPALAAAAVLAVPAAVAAAPASASAHATSVSAQAAKEPVQTAGISRCLGLWANGGRVKLQHISSCGPTGYYHIRIWGGGRSDNGDTYRYVGLLREFAANWPVPSGTNICAELWYHKPGGGYESWGLPCDPM
ncbi:hypothetical protein ACFVH6_21200 [Spirillospora sp. NPDC127200]